MTASCVWPMSNGGFALFVTGLFLFGALVGFGVTRVVRRISR